MDVERIVKLAHARDLAASGKGREVRQRSGISLREAAGVIREAAGVRRTSPTTVWRWENGAARPTGDAGVAYAELIDALEEVTEVEELDDATA